MIIYKLVKFHIEIAQETATNFWMLLLFAALGFECYDMGTCSNFLDCFLQSRRHVGCFMGSQAVSFKPPVSWSDLILDKSLVDMLFTVISIFGIELV